MYSIEIMGQEFETALTKAAIESATLYAEKEKIQARLAEIDARLLNLNQTVAALSRVVDKAFLRKVEEKFDIVLSTKAGLKETCLRILRARFPKAMTASEIKATMESIGYDTKKYANSTAVIEMTLKRLVPAEAEEASVEGKRAYKYKSPTLPGIGGLAKPAPTPIGIPGEAVPPPIPTAMKDES